MKNSIEKKNLLLIAAVCLLISGCGTHNCNQKTNIAEYYTAVSIPPYVYKGSIEVCRKDSCWPKDTCMQIDVNRLSSKEIIDYFLRSEKAQVTIESLDNDGSARYGSIFISNENKNYKVTLDYMNYRSFTAGKNLYLAGVGLRMTAYLHTNKAGITLGDPASIGFAANSDWLKGTLSLDIIGINSENISNILPLPSEINQNTIQNAMQAFATIKSKIHDEETRLTPHIFSYLIRTENDTITNEFIWEQIDGLQQSNLEEQEDYLREQEDYLRQAAFDYLCGRFYDEALLSFKQLQKDEINEINSLIIALLENPKNREELKENSFSEKWVEIYKTIIEKGEGKLPLSIIEQLNSAI